MILSRSLRPPAMKIGPCTLFNVSLLEWANGHFGRTARISGELLLMTEEELPELPRDMAERNSSEFLTITVNEAAFEKADERQAFQAGFSPQKPAGLADMCQTLPVFLQSSA
jgi:hypothetical protein